MPAPEMMTPTNHERPESTEMKNEVSNLPAVEVVAPGVWKAATTLAGRGQRLRT